MHSRLQRLRSAVADLGLDSFVVTGTANIRYLSGFSGSHAVCVISPDRAAIITDGRYREQVAKQCPDWEAVIYSKKIEETLSELIGGRRSVGFEKTASFAFYDELKRAVKPGASLLPIEDIVESQRAVKHPEEIAAVRRAVACASASYRHLSMILKPGVSERELAAELDYRMMKAGADGPAFETVVASGPNSSMPHAGITDRVLGEGDLVTFDFGATRDGYHSDISRTIVLGEPDRRQKEILEAAAGATNAALESVRPGARAVDVDGAARKYLAGLGLEERFVHSLGHGVGLEVHEKPTLSALSEDVLEAGMVFTVEPGLYFEGWGGVRVEQMVLVTPEGYDVLSDGI